MAQVVPDTDFASSSSTRVGTWKSCMWRSAAVLSVALSTCLEGGCRTSPNWPLWESYAKSSFDGQGRIVDHSAGDRTTSEGQAYGMFFALVANDRARLVIASHSSRDR